MPYTIVFTPEAEEQLVALYDYISMQTSPSTAEKFTSSIITYCQSLGTFPHRGNKRDDIHLDFALPITRNGRSLPSRSKRIL